MTAKRLLPLSAPFKTFSAALLPFDISSCDVVLYVGGGKTFSLRNNKEARKEGYRDQISTSWALFLKEGGF